MIEKTYIAYKGFDKNLSCRGEKFQIDVPNKKQVSKRDLRLCSSDGWHYCDNLLDVFTHYSNKDGNRFCEIEILGNFTHDQNKGITDHFKIVREISKEEIENLKGKMQKKRIGNNLGLDLVKKLQNEYPLMQVAGSVALFLHGISLKRLESESLSSDVDVIFPYYQRICDEKFNVEESDEIRSGSDFGEVLYIDNKKFDIRISAEQKYEVIEYDGFKYRVSLFEHIMEAKFRYALKGQIKHRQDVYEICGKGKAK